VVPRFLQVVAPPSLWPINPVRLWRDPSSRHSFCVESPNSPKGERCSYRLRSAKFIDFCPPTSGGKSAADKLPTAVATNAEPLQR
jgi:hypothetical protein